MSTNTRIVEDFTAKEARMIRTEETHKPVFRTLPWLMLPFVSLCLTVLPAQAQLKLISPQPAVAGKPLGDWTSEWWKWAFSHSGAENPMTDTTGRFANLNQSGPVFFLAQSPGVNLTRKFTVPEGKHILISIIGAEFSQAELGAKTTEKELRQAAKKAADLIDNVYLRLDGEDMSDTSILRVTSPPFRFKAAPNNPFTPYSRNGKVWEGDSGLAVSDGYFAMLEPPEPGTYVIEFGGSLGSVFTVENRVTIAVGGK
jgi:hypothetical protein